MTAPAQPLAPCPFCGGAAESTGASRMWAVCKAKGCAINGNAILIPDWNRRAAPPAPAGEVGELVERCRSAVKFGAINRDLLNACAAALTAQAAALEEAESVKWFGRYQRASRALLALGCRMGLDGRWEKPCPACEDYATDCRECGCTRFRPVTSLESGEGEK